MTDTSNPMNAVVLPPGVTVVGAREGTQPNLAGQLVQGMNFSFQLPGGTTTSLFIPYNLLSDTNAVSSMIAARISAIQAVTGGQSG